jgi:ribosome biogenesis protein ENP2
MPFDPRTMPKSQNPLFRPQPKAQPGPKPQLVALSAGQEERPVSSAKSVSFGQRIKNKAQEASASGSKAAKADDPSIISRKLLADGGMELSFIPKSAPAKGKGKQVEGIVEDDYTPDKGTLAREAAREKKRRGIEEFGAGMERGGEEEERVREEDKQGRQKRRTGGRSASGNTFRRL